MRARLWPWIAVWLACLALVVALFVVYARLPTDGFTGDMSSYSAQGFRLLWELEPRDDGLRVDDVVVRAGGHTVDEWLSGAARGPEWNAGGVVSYEVLRDGALMTIPVRMAVVSPLSIVHRWALQLLASAGFLLVGTFVFLKRMRELPARILMLFCVFACLQYLGDSFNLQYPIMPLRWLFWAHFLYENLTYDIALSAVSYFALLYPRPNPVLARFPRLVPAVIFSVLPVELLVSMLAAPGWTHGIVVANQVSWVFLIVMAAFALSAALHSIRTARDPVSRAQMRWILWSVAVGGAVLVPTYVAPLIFNARPFLPHPFMMLGFAGLALVFAIGILKFRLFAIDIIINRTLVYGTLTALLTGMYLLLVRVLTVVAEEVLNRRNDTLVVFLATLCIALAFAPLRRRVQLLIDRAFYRTKLDFQRLLPEMSEQLATSILVEQLTAMLQKKLPATLQISWAECAVLDATGECFVLPGDNRRYLGIDHPLVEHLRGGQPLLRLQPRDGVSLEAQAFLDGRGIELAIPLLVGPELVGIYSLGAKLSSNGYTREEVRLLEILGKQAAIAVQNTRLFDAEREQRVLAQALDTAAAVVGSTLDLEQVLDRILGQVERVVKGDAFSIVLLGDKAPRVVRGRGYAALGDPAAVSHDDTLAELVRSRRPVVVSDASAQAQAGPGWLQSFVAAPIKIGEVVVGALRVDGTRAYQFEPRDAARLEAFTHHAAAAIANARLYEKAQAEIIERRLTEQRIVSSLKEKEVLLKEIHHRVKNNLQVISSILYLQSRSITDAKVLEAFQDSRTRVKSMALVHEMLYRSPDLARVDFAAYGQSLASFLSSTQGSGSQTIEMQVDIDPIALTVDAAIPCGLILNELVTNSLKHAFRDRDRGAIRIAMRAGEGCTFVMSVGDDGGGLPAGFDFRKTESLGLQIVGTLVNQLGGTMELEGGVGTCFRITFPDPGAPS